MPHQTAKKRGTDRKAVVMSDYVLYTRSMNTIRVARSARKHGIGKAHMLAALSNAGEPTIDGDALAYVGVDDRGVELELVLVPNDRGEGWAIIHAMPTAYRRN